MTSPTETLHAAAKVLRCAHRYPVQVLTDAEMEQLIGTGRPLADCLDCGSREDGQDVAAHLREPLAAWLEGVAKDIDGHDPDGGCECTASDSYHRAMDFAAAILGRTS